MADWSGFLRALGETWPAEMAKSAFKGAVTPGGILQGQYNVTPEIPGQWSEVDEFRARQAKGQMFERAQDLGGLAMTGGLPISTPGVTLTSGFRRPPPAVGGYHGTGTPEIFTQFHPYKMQDLGAHMSVDPGVASKHAIRMRGRTREETLPRIMPVVADINKAFRFPGDPTDWTNPDLIMRVLEDQAHSGKRIPKSMISDFEAIEKQRGGWEKNFIPAMKERGYDAIHYPHSSPRDIYDPKCNSWMLFDPYKMLPRYSAEGQDLIKQRGILEPMKTAPWSGLSFDNPAEFSKLLKEAVKTNPERWIPPKGVLSKYDELVPARPFADYFNQRRDSIWKESIQQAEEHAAALERKHGVSRSDPIAWDKFIRKRMEGYGRY